MTALVARLGAEEVDFVGTYTLGIHGNYMLPYASQHL
jgi:hypothetical protein